MSACSHQCGGQCCRGFYIGFDVRAYGLKYQEIVNWRDYDPVNNVLEPWMVEHVTIAEMLVPLMQEPDEMPLYTCRNLDTATGLCTIYERRPRMCSEYPAYDYPEGQRYCIFCGFEPPPDMPPELVVAADALPVLAT